MKHAFEYVEQNAKKSVKLVVCSINSRKLAEREIG